MVKAAPPLYLFLILTEDVVECVTTHQARGIHSIRTDDAHHGIVIVQVRQPLQILLRVLPLIVIVHVAHVGLIHRDPSLPKSPKVAPLTSVPKLDPA